MSKLRRALYALLVSALVLGGLELGLRTLGVARDDRLISPLLFQRPLDAPHADDAPDGWKVLADGPMRRALPTGLRVVVVGGSAADGVGATPFGRFSHLLERLLVQARPGHPVEIVNLARAGLASRHVARVLDGGLADLSPQLVIVYSGNNELHELRALKHSSAAYRANLEGIRRRLHGLHGYRLLQRALGRDQLQPIDSGPAVAPGLPDLPTTADAQDRALARRIYREQLSSMIRASRAAGARVLLTTVAGNRADWPGDTDREPSTTELQLVDALSKALGEGDTQDVERLATQIEDGDPAQASLYTAGRALLALGQTHHAMELLDRAELQDARPTRSNRQLRELVRELARAESTGLCDLAAQLDAEAPRGVAGFEHFGDGCHLNAAGQVVAARVLATCVADMDLWPIAEELGPLELDPFRLDHDLRSDGEAFPAPLEGDPPGLMAARAGHDAFTAGQLEQALQHYEQALDQGAPVGSISVSRAIVHWHQGQPERAGVLLRAASEALGPDPELDNLRASLAL